MSNSRNLLILTENEPCPHDDVPLYTEARDQGQESGTMFDEEERHRELDRLVAEAQELGLYEPLTTKGE